MGPFKLWKHIHISPPLVRGGADKSLALPGWKQATATKVGIYATYSPRSSTLLSPLL